MLNKTKMAEIMLKIVEELPSPFSPAVLAL